MDWRLIPAEPDLLARLFYWRDEMEKELKAQSAAQVSLGEPVEVPDCTLGEEIQQFMDSLVAQHERVKLARDKIPMALLKLKQSELAACGLHFEPYLLRRG